MRITLYSPARWSPQRLHFMTADAGAAGTAGAGGDASKAAADADPDKADDKAGEADKGKAGTGETLPDDPDTLKAEIAKLRKENGAARTTAKENAAKEARDAVLQEFGKALGFIKDGDDAPDAAALTKAATDATAEARIAKVELAVYRGAGAHQGNPDALLDSRAFLAKVTDLDPADADFQKKVSAAIKTAVTENAQLKAAQGASKSSVDHSGGTGEAADIDAQIAAATAAGDHRRAIALKRQRAAGTTT